MFGTLIAGPEFAKSAQDVLIRKRVQCPGDLITHDGDHPVPALRPMIALAALQAIADLQDDGFRKKLASLVQLLDGRWQPIWEEACAEEKQGRPEPEVTYFGQGDADGGPAVTLDELRAQVRPMVDMVLKETTFAVGSAGVKQQQNLLTATNHWGKARSATETEEIRTMEVKLAEDTVASIQMRIDQVQANDSPKLESGEEDLFERFLEFVRERQETKKGTGVVPAEEWKAVLEFDLALTTATGIPAANARKATPVATSTGVTAQRLVVPDRLQQNLM